MAESDPTSHEGADNPDDGVDGSSVNPSSEDGESSSESAISPDERAAAGAAALELLSELDPGEHYNNVSSLARASHDSALQPHPFSKSLPFHDPTCVVVDPVPQGREIMHLYGRAAYPRLDEIVIAPFMDPRVDHLLTDLHHRLIHENHNVALVTNHGELIDIALVLGALLVAMTDENRHFGVLDDHTDLDELIPRSNLLLSRMVATRSIFNIPTPQVLEAVCRCFYSIPQTQSRRRARLEPEVVRANNDLMREKLDQQLAGGGQLLAMAASGSQDLSLAASLVSRVRQSWRHRRGEEPEDAESLHLQPLYNGTIQLMLTCEYVLPVSISLTGDNPVCSVGGLTSVHTKDDCHSIMEWIASAYQDATGVTTVYHQHEDDFLSQVREALRN